MDWYINYAFRKKAMYCLGFLLVAAQYCTNIEDKFQPKYFKNVCLEKKGFNAILSSSSLFEGSSKLTRFTF